MMIADITLTPAEAKRVTKVLVNGEDVTWRCYRLDTVTGTAWCWKLAADSSLKLRHPRESECLVGVVVVKMK